MVQFFIRHSGEGWNPVCLGNLSTQLCSILVTHMLFSTPSGQYSDFSIKGLSEYLDEKLINDNFASYKELDHYIRELEDKKKNAQITNVIFTVAGVSMAILGICKKETNEFGIETYEPNKAYIK